MRLPATHAFGVIQPCRGECGLLLLVESAAYVGESTAFLSR